MAGVGLRFRRVREGAQGELNDPPSPHGSQCYTQRQRTAGVSRFPGPFHPRALLHALVLQRLTRLGVVPRATPTRCRTRASTTREVSWPLAPQTSPSRSAALRAAPAFRNASSPPWFFVMTARPPGAHISTTRVVLFAVPHCEVLGLNPLASLAGLGLHRVPLHKDPQGP